MSVVALIDELRAAGVRVIKPRPNGTLHLPKHRLTPDLIERVRATKTVLVAYLRAADAQAAAGEALALFARLKTFTLPAARAIAKRYAACPLLDADAQADASVILAILQGIEREFIALGGGPDPELDEIATAVTIAFPTPD